LPVAGEKPAGIHEKMLTHAQNYSILTIVGWPACKGGPSPGGIVVLPAFFDITAPWGGGAAPVPRDRNRARARAELMKSLSSTDGWDMAECRACSSFIILPSSMPLSGPVKPLAHGWAAAKGGASKQIEVCSGKLKFVTDFDEPYVRGPSEILHSSFILPLAARPTQSNL